MTPPVTGGTPRVLTLVFTDLVDSTALKTRLGDSVAAELIGRHHRLVRGLVDEYRGREIDSAGDGFFLTFDTPSAAASFALRLLDAHRADGELPTVRVGIHLGEVTERPTPPGSSKAILVEGLAVDLAARIQSLARPDQILLSRAAFDAARQRLRGDDLAVEVEWRAYGPYLFKGIDDPVEVGGAGIAGVSPLEAPPDSEKARRAVAAGDELTLGWRPAIGLLVPGREHWRLQEQLGAGAIGEVWLAAHDKTHARRVFKFCFEGARLRGLKREVVLLRLLRERLGERRDIAQVLDWEFERPPFYLETAYTEAGDLLEWSSRKGGIAAVPLTDRIEIAAQAAEALAAAHEAGILHKDLKPSNLLISEADPMRRPRRQEDVSVGGGTPTTPAASEGPRVCLTDFGIGLVTSRESLSAAGVTVAGMTETLLSSSSSTTGAGTRLYMAPEVIEGRPATERSDIYGLGVVLYQMAIGDFSRALAPGWERAVADDVLREDIAACLDGDAERRLGSARELATRLRGLEQRRAERQAHERGRVAAETSGRRRRVLVAASAATLLLVLVGGLFVRQQRAVRGERERAEQVRWAREEALPEIERLARTGDLARAFALAERAEAAIPTDPVLAERWSEIAATGTLRTTPPGARISVLPYAGDPANWKVLGESPLAGVRLPRGVYRWRIEKDGFEPVEVVRRPPDDAAPYASSLVPFDVELVPSGTIPAGMVRVAGGSHRVWLTGFDNMTPVALDPFFIDRFEVTNREFREFVESGGYGSVENWPDGPGREARPGFLDRTGRPGPATWELGTYPDREDDLPIRGLSWFEAEAYCRFRGKSLPTVYHWARAAFAPNERMQPLSDAIIPSSNLASDAPAPVGRHQSMAAFGAYDMAGNVKEWAWNATADGRRYLLGGAWNEPGYMFYEADAQSPASREPNYGVRCMALEPGGAIPERLAAPVGGVEPGPRKIAPVSDEVLAGFLAAGSYAAGPLEAAIDSRDESSEHWIVETVSFAAAYGGERVPAYLLLPKNVTPPFQTVVYWPGGSANTQPSREDLRQATNMVLRHLLRSGRAVLYPVLKGTYDRPSPAPDPNLAAKMTSDLNRSLDYLESRADIDAERIAYAGLSWGAGMAAYLVRPGLERLDALILVAGGLFPGLPPHLDAVNYAPRIKTPVLMINGRYDSSYPVETSSEPLFRLFGAPEADKKLLILDSGHVPEPTILWIKEALDWLDRYLGPVGSGEAELLERPDIRRQAREQVVELGERAAVLPLGAKRS